MTPQRGPGKKFDLKAEVSNLTQFLSVSGIPLHGPGIPQLPMPFYDGTLPQTFEIVKLVQNTGSPHTGSPQKGPEEGSPEGLPEIVPDGSEEEEEEEEEAGTPPAGSSEDDEDNSPTTVSGEDESAEEEPDDDMPELLVSEKFSPEQATFLALKKGLQPLLRITKEMTRDLLHELDTADMANNGTMSIEKKFSSLTNITSLLTQTFFDRYFLEFDTLQPLARELADGRHRLYAQEMLPSGGDVFFKLTQEILDPSTTKHTADLNAVVEDVDDFENTSLGYLEEVLESVDGQTSKSGVDFFRLQVVKLRQQLYVHELTRCMSDKLEKVLISRGTDTKRVDEW